MPELPIYPERKEAPGYALARRRDRVVELDDELLTSVSTSLVVECVFETLRLTGAGIDREIVDAVAGGVATQPVPGEEERLIRGQLQALDAIDAAARKDGGLTLELIQSVHRSAVPGSDGALRTTELPAQFKNARLSPPRFIADKVSNLQDWMMAESGRAMFPPERMALFFGRFLEIAPFAKGNFRVAHLLLSFFTRADGYPFVWLQLAEAEPVRSEVERAILFDTLPLVNRFNEAVSRALTVCEEAGGIES